MGLLHLVLGLALGSGAVVVSGSAMDQRLRGQEAGSAGTARGLSTPPQLVARGNSSALSFKILQLADLHYTGNASWPCRTNSETLIQSNTLCTEATTTQFVDVLLDAEQPDFVVFSGDNVQTLNVSNRQAAVDAFTKGVEERKIPYAVVFGNHDDENDFSRQQILDLVMQKQYSYAQRGPTTIDGVGNYELTVQAPIEGAWGALGSDVFRMYFLDSGAYPNATLYPDTTSVYDWIKPSQIDYYRNLSLSHSSNGTQTPTPAVMFFHIPLPEYGDANSSNRNGEQNENESAPTVNTNLFATLVERNEVKAVFCGHDHVNEFCYKRQGVQLCYGGGTGFGEAYGEEGFARRARVIEWSINTQGQRSIHSWKRHFGDLGTRFTEESLYAGSPMQLSQQTSTAADSLGLGIVTLAVLQCLTYLSS